MADIDDPFRPGTFYDNFNAGVGALGVEQIPLAFDVARQSFNSIKERDAFLNILKKIGDADG